MNFIKSFSKHIRRKWNTKKVIFLRISKYPLDDLSQDNHFMDSFNMTINAVHDISKANELLKTKKIKNISKAEKLLDIADEKLNKALKINDEGISIESINRFRFGIEIARIHIENIRRITSVVIN